MCDGCVCVCWGGNACMCVSTCMQRALAYVCVCLRVSPRECAFVRACVCVHTFVSVCVHICVSVCVSVRVCLCTPM